MNQEGGQLADIEFFAKTAKEIRKVREESIEAQTAARRVKKIAAMRQQTVKPKQAVPDNILRNIVIDFLRTKNLNYSYSVFMRECDLLSEQVILKGELASLLQLRQQLSNAPINATIIELLLERHCEREGERKEVGEMGVQVELVRVDHSLNSTILNQVQLTSIRREVEEREKKHYENLLAGLRKSLSISLREDAKKQYDSKMKEMRTEYERQVAVLKQKNKEFLVGNPKIHPKVQEYLKRIEQLQSNNMAFAERVKELEKQKIVHNCLKVPKVVEKQREVDALRKDLERKKQQYQLALKTFHTSTESIAVKKKEAEMPKQTDLFLADLKNKKQSKDYMIDQMYGRMLVMDRRIDALSKDNQTLRETNRQLGNKVAQVQEFSNRLKESTAQQAKTEEKMKMVTVKPQSKNVSVGVTPEDFKEKKRQHAIDQPSSPSSSSDSELDEQITRKTKFKLKLHEMDAEMQTEKNRLRLFLDDFS